MSCWEKRGGLSEGVSANAVVISGAVISIIARSLWPESYLAKRLDVSSLHGIGVGELPLMGVFIASALLLPRQLAFAIYVAAYIAFLFQKVLFRVVGKVRKLITVASGTR